MGGFLSACSSARIRQLSTCRGARVAAIGAVMLATTGLGCFGGGEGESQNHGNPSTAPLLARDASVILEGCAIDDTQLATLATPAAHQILHEVVFLCAAIGADGQVSPASSDRTAFAAGVAQVHALGYRVSIATTLGASWSTPADVPTASSFVKALATDDAKRTLVAQELASLATQTSLDGVDLALPTLDDASRDALTELVRAIGLAVRPSRTLGVFAPPSSQVPSDVAGGPAYDLAAIGALVDRVRLMTLDYSCCGAPPGPTTDPSWAIGVEQLGQGQISRPSVRLAVAYPLYGWDTVVDATASSTPVTYGQAINLAAKMGASIVRGATDAPYFDYMAPDGRHQVWFDDASSTLGALHAFDGALPRSVDLVFYGLGAEDPTLWTTLAQATP